MSKDTLLIVVLNKFDKKKKNSIHVFKINS